MSRAETRVVYTDLDGTLLGSGGSLFRNHAGDFTLAGALALEMLVSRGVELALVSGRSMRLLAENARMLGADS
ncbi:MAG: HAD family phosphatase, partial [Actinomycetota bacterium]